MFRDLTIKNYRCFKDFSIDGLARVNLIVGQNNSGKTSFLEAVYLLDAKTRFSSIFKLLQLRGEFSEVVGNTGTFEYEFPVTHLFNGHEPMGTEPYATISIATNKGQAQRLMLVLDIASQEIAYAPFRDSHYDNGAQNRVDRTRPLFPYELRLEHSQRIGVSAFAVNEDLFMPIAPKDLALAPTPFRFGASGTIDTQQLARHWDVVAQSLELEHEVIAALRIIAPSVVDIRLTSTRTAGTFLIGRERMRKRIPLSSLGDGMRRVLALTISSINAEDSILLIDEIDTGLHHSALTNVWRLLIETAQRLNVQIFATTHSWDCVVAFQEALAQTRNGQADLGMLFRLQERDGEIIAVDYDAEKLDVAVEHMIEVR